MSGQALAWAIDQTLPGVAKLVLIALSNHADHTTGQVHFHAPLIAQEASIAERSLWRYLGALERNGYLAKDAKRTPDGEQREYWLALDRDPTLGWAWDAHDPDRSQDDDAAEADRAVARATPLAPQSAVPGFRRAEQDSARAEIAATQAAQKRELVGVIEGSEAFRAWVKSCRDQGRIPPFVRAIIVNGQQRRGFEMPTLFPPAETVESS